MFLGFEILFRVARLRPIDLEGVTCFTVPKRAVNMSDLFWLTDAQMARLEPFVRKSHGKPRVDDRRMLSGIIFINRNGLRWRDAPAAYGRIRRCTTAGNGGATRASSPG